MNNSLLTLAYIDYIMTQNPQILFIEVWDRVLYARMRKGRNKFISKQGLDFCQPIYYKPNEFKSIIKKYHPDTKQSTTKSISELNTYKKLSADIILVRKAMSVGFGERGCNASKYVQSLESFTPFTHILPSQSRDITIQKAEQEILQAGLDDYEPFDELGPIFTTHEEWEYISYSYAEEVFRMFKEALSRSVEREKEWHRKHGLTDPDDDPHTIQF